MLNKDLDLEEIKNSFHNNGYVKIDNFLDADYAKSIAQSIFNKIEWDLCYLSENGPVSLKQPVYTAYTPQQQAELNQKIMSRAMVGFSYFYFRSDLINATNQAVKDFYEDLNSEEFLTFSRNLTDEKTIQGVNGQLACFSPGCFLRKHSDSTDKEKRVAAYVINFTPEWKNDWGGLLHILDDEHKVIDALEPLFNSISLFKVPTWHYVSQVANYARGRRFTATGWMLKPD